MADDLHSWLVHGTLAPHAQPLGAEVVDEREALLPDFEPFYDDDIKGGVGLLNFLDLELDNIDVAKGVENDLLQALAVLPPRAHTALLTLNTQISRMRTLHVERKCALQ